MNIAVCDDERLIREQLAGLIREQKPDCTVDLYAAGEQLLSAKVHYDMIFLDIQMEGLNGIETARLLRERGEDGILVFITALKEYVFEAFDVAAFHYLLKPVRKEKFIEVFQRADAETKKQKNGKKDLLFVKTRGRCIKIEKDRILYVESRARKAAIHTDKEVLEIYATMNRLEEELGEHFYRCHRGYLVNLAQIREYGTDRITLGNGENVYLSKEKYPEFVKKYMRYLRDGGTVYV